MDGRYPISKVLFVVQAVMVPIWYTDISSLSDVPPVNLSTTQSVLCALHVIYETNRFYTFCEGNGQSDREGE